MTLGFGDMIVIILYFALIVGVGIYYSKKVTNSDKNSKTVHKHRRPPGPLAPGRPI